MNKWIIAALAMVIPVIAGCGAKMPTVSEESQGDAYQTKQIVNTEYTGTSNDVINTAQ